MSKYFVLDTNVLLHNPDAIYSFADNTVVLPITVIEELDNFKKTSDKKGMHARHVLRELDRLIQKGALLKGAKIRSGGKLRIMLAPRNLQIPDIDPSLSDNKIITVAWELQKKGNVVFFISKDVNARIKAQALGIKTRDYEKQKVEYTSLYKGWRELVLDQEQINILSQKHVLPYEDTKLFPNECVWIKAQDNPKTSLIGLSFR